MKFRSIIFVSTLLIGMFSIQHAFGQKLKLKSRNPNALSGKDFAISISDSTLTLQEREEIIYNEIRNGNVPNFLRKLKEVKDSLMNGSSKMVVSYFVLSDYMCIGSDSDFFYVPMTPILAQRIANLTKCTLPTKKLVDAIYKNATIKLIPKPIPPTKAMTTVPIFIAHNDSLTTQLIKHQNQHLNGELTAGNKKDIIISNKIYTEKTPKVVIYGWHKMDGKAIQPVYNKHTNLWADYSHGLRLVQDKIFVNGKKMSFKKAAQNTQYSSILSDEGTIEKPFYPITAYQLAN